jgi:hypothetical protein
MTTFVSLKQIHGRSLLPSLETLAKAQGLKDPAAALQHIVDRVLNEEPVRQAVFDDFHCVHCGSVKPADWIKVGALYNCSP